MVSIKWARCIHRQIKMCFLHQLSSVAFEVWCLLSITIISLVKSSLRGFHVIYYICTLTTVLAVFNLLIINTRRNDVFCTINCFSLKFYTKDLKFCTDKNDSNESFGQIFYRCYFEGYFNKLQQAHI